VYVTEPTALVLLAPVSALIDLKLQTSIMDWPSHPISGSEKQQVKSATIMRKGERWAR
jgi:hypothetical protein